jgi:dihydroorotate dehydrogenase
MIYRAFFRLLIVLRVDAEVAHKIAARSLRTLTAPRPLLLALHRLLSPRKRRLQVRVMGLDFPTPLGCAAGVDKSATWFDPLHALGFGFVEVGTVTAEAQPGNPKPRVTRLPRDGALLNAMGFPNDGAARVAERLRKRRLAGVPIGVNVGKTRVVDLDDAVDDYRRAVRKLAPVADYIVLNVSSPNTPGLSQLQSADRFAALIRDCREEARDLRPDLPVLVKIGPDLSDAELDAVADSTREAGLDGIVAVNTTTDLSAAKDSQDQIARLRHRGGISGAPLQPRALAVLERLYGRVGEDVALVSVGGVETAEDVWERILAGASLVQAYTGFVYGGPLWPSRIDRGLARLLRDSEFASIEAAIGRRG